MFRILSTQAQAGSTLATMLGVVAVLFALVILTIMASKTEETLDDACVNVSGSTIAEGATRAGATINCTYADAREVTSDLVDGAKDASDLGQVLMLFVILSALFSIGIYGMFRMRQ